MRFNQNISRVLFTLVATGAAASLVGCNAGVKKPDWVKNPYIRHAESDYFASVGRASNASDAEANASSEIAREIARAIDHQPINLQDYEMRTTKAGFESGRTIELLQLAEFDEARRLLGFDVADRFVDDHDEDDVTYYAHGILNRADLVKAYETEMRRNTQFANRMTDLSSREPVTMRRFAALRAGLAASQAYRDLRFIRDSLGDAAYAGDDSLDPPSISTDDLSAQIAALRQSIAGSVESIGPTAAPDLFMNEIRQSLQRVGVPVRTDRQEGHIRILVNWDTSPIHEQRDDIQLVTFRLSVELVEDVSGFSLASRTWDAKTGGRTDSDAEKEAARLARRDLARDVDEFISTAIYEQSLNAR